MPVVSETDIERLVAELQGAGLEPADAYRSAFIALAVASGWTKARASRYLGVTRQRVGQKYNKLQTYQGPATPVLNRLLKKANATEAVRSDRDHMVAFKDSDWRDLDFAAQMLDRFHRNGNGA